MVFLLLPTPIEKKLQRNCKRIIETISQSFWPKLYGPILLIGWSSFFHIDRELSKDPIGMLLSRILIMFD